MLTVEGGHGEDTREDTLVVASVQSAHGQCDG